MEEFSVPPKLIRLVNTALKEGDVSNVKVPIVRKEIVRLYRKHIPKLEKHPNLLAINLLDNSEDIYRLKRHKLLDIPFRFNEYRVGLLCIVCIVMSVLFVL